MSTDDGGHRDAAIDALAVREYERAGDRYTRAGHRLLADPREREGIDPFGPDGRGWVGAGVAAFVVAAVAYRVAGAESRATRRAVAGEATARDLRRGLDRPGQGACLLELAGDLRVAGGVDGAAEVYEDAIDAYQAAGRAIDEPQGLATTPLFEAAAGPIEQVARGLSNGEIAITWEDLHGSDPSRPGDFLAARARYKRRRFASLVAGAVSEGHLAAPRGTTEYGNANHRCPACGSTDVNWSGSEVLCLRCSTPTERV